MNQCDLDPLISYDDALQQLIDKVSPLGKTVRKPLLEAYGEVIAESQSSSIDVPAADNSAMDGYALNTSDLSASGQTRLPVSQRIAAGEAAQPLQPGTAARIFTGALIPTGADAVIMQEQVVLVDETISFEQRPETGANIRVAGNDIRNGDSILSKGTRLRAQEIGLAASVGLESLLVYEKLCVGIFLTGDELVEPGEALAPGQIYDSNR